MFRTLVLCGSVALGIIIMVLPSRSVQAAPLSADGRWSEPISLSGNDRRTGGWFPAIVTDPYGQVHIVWNGRAPGRPVASFGVPVQRLSEAAGWLLYTRWDGQRWTGPTEIAAIGVEGDALRSALTIDSQSRLHLLYRGIDLRTGVTRGAENEPIRYSSVDAVRADEAGAWSKGVPLTEHTPAYFPEIVADNQGVLHALTTEAGATTQYAVYYHRSTDGGKTWSDPVLIEQGHASSRWRVQLKVGPNNDLNAVWEVVDPFEPSSRSPVGFVYARSTDGGLSWTTTVFAPEKQGAVYPKSYDGTGWRIQPAVGIDGRGQVVLVWRENGTDFLYFQRSSDGQEWTLPARVGGVARGVARPFDRYDMALDSAGRLHMVMVGFPDAAPSAMALLHSEWLGYSWATPDVIALGATPPFPESPRIAIGEGNRLHVVWFGGDGQTPIGIWYSTRTTAAPHIPALPLPDDAAARAILANPVAPTPTPSRPFATATPVVTRQYGNSVSSEQLQPAAWPIVAGLLGSAATLLVLLMYRRVSAR